jgi:predicted Zn-dependent protease
LEGLVPKRIKDRWWNVASRKALRRDAVFWTGAALRLVAALTVALALTLPANVGAASAQEPQEQESLGDVARKAREDKEKNRVKAHAVITDETLQSGKAGEPDDAEAKKAIVYFVAIGSAPSSEIKDLVNYYKAKFNLRSEVLPTMQPTIDDVDVTRKQLIAEAVIEDMKRVYAEQLKSPTAIVIGITSGDMYPRGENWQFCFGWRVPEDRIAVVSVARMSLHYEGEPTEQANVTTRMRKVVTKDIGIMGFGKNTSHNPRSVLFDGILGIEELDQVSEDF